MSARLTRAGFKQSHVSLPSRTYPTLAEGKTITFEEIGRDPSIPEWKRVLVNGKLQIISRKEVCVSKLIILPTLTAPSERQLMESSMSLTAPFKTSSYTVPYVPDLNFSCLLRVLEYDVPAMPQLRPLSDEPSM